MQHIKVFKTSCAYIIATLLNVYFYLKALCSECGAKVGGYERPKEETRKVDHENATQIYCTACS